MNWRTRAAYAAKLAAAVAGVVTRQRDIGIDIVNDGEFGKPMSQAYDYGVWWNYAYERLDGFVSPDSVPESAHKQSSVANLALTSFANRRDWQKFNEFYQDPQSTGLTGSAARRRTRRPVCAAPIRYKGQAKIQADIDNLKTAMAATGAAEGFLTSVAPASFARGEDLHYKTEEEFVFAAAEAMREEYKAIIDGRPRAADRRSEPPRQLGHDQPGAAARRVQEVRHGAHRGAQPCAARLSRGSHPLSHLLGQLARAAHHRHPVAGHHRRRAAGADRRLFGGGRQRAP